MPYKKTEVLVGFIAVPNHAPIEDLTGRRFGKWAVLEYLGASTWQCRCECGKELTITNWRLKTTIQCNRCANALPAGESAFTRALDHYHQNAKNANREFSLTVEEVRQLFSGKCFYCDCPPSIIKKDRWGQGVFSYNGIDRVDNNKGYIAGNCVSCCFVCNRMKFKFSPEDFVKHVCLIAVHCAVLKDATNA